MMNETLKAAFTTAGVSVEAITKLEEQELNEISDFANLSAQDLTSVGLKLGTVNKIFGVVRALTAPPTPPVQAVTPVPVAAPPVPAAQTVTLPVPLVQQISQQQVNPLGAFAALIPPQTQQEAAARFCAAPSDQLNQAHWRRFFNDATLIFPGATAGTIDQGKTLEAVEIYTTSEEAPSELDGQPLLSLNEFLQSTFPACPFTGHRILRGGASLTSNVHYGFLVGSDCSLAAVQNNPGMRFLAFAAEVGKIARPGDLAGWKNAVIDFRNLVQGQNLNTPPAIKAAVAGTAWDETATEYIRDANSGGVIAMRACSRLITQAKRRTTRTPRIENTLGNLLLTGVGSGLRDGGLSEETPESFDGGSERRHNRRPPNA